MAEEDEFWKLMKNWQNNFGGPDLQRYQEYRFLQGKVLSEAVEFSNKNTLAFVKKAFLDSLDFDYIALKFHVSFASRSMVPIDRKHFVYPFTSMCLVDDYYQAKKTTLPSSDKRMCESILQSHLGMYKFIKGDKKTADVILEDVLTKEKITIKDQGLSLSATPDEPPLIVAFVFSYQDISFADSIRPITKKEDQAIYLKDYLKKPELLNSIHFGLFATEYAEKAKTQP